ncbi:MAG: filamentous hemagglutinin N-terminal domain-containing protein [Nitrospirae bacterium]|nr:filamentous hemagglutinin N-terminal domain-containing protein [Nitrospirota bacterium]
MKITMGSVKADRASKRCNSSSFRATAAALGILFSLHMTVPLSAAEIPAPNALPSGGQITSGQGSVSTSGSSMQIIQQSDKMIMNWQSFNIGQNASVNFVQPGSTSTALNRVVGSDPSGIYGSLTANGRVFLLNPSGIIFGSTARVDVGGMVASTLNMKDSDFLIGSYNFYKDGTAGSIHNLGMLSAKAAGFIAMLAPEIRNEGIVAADLGTVAFGAGDKMTLNFSGNSLLGITVEEGALNALIENKNLIQADGGAVLMTARAANELALSAINNEGIVRARTIQEKNGVIVLDSGDNGLTTISGTLDASSTDSRGGRIIATGERVLVKSGALLTASGALGGGEVLIGGSWQNSDTTVRQATATVIESGALLQANATDTGNGGTVVAWSDITNPLSVTRAYGIFEAKGGPNGGDGGRIETSGHWLDVAGIKADASAVSGKTGLWLLDPYNVIIGAVTSGTAYANPFIPSADSTILASDIATTLQSGTSVTITTGTAGSSIGDITVSSAITKASGDTDVTLTLNAANSIVVDQAISNTGGTGKLNVVLDADNNNGTGDGAGIVMLNADITTNGGNLSFGTGRTATINSFSTLVGGDVYVAGAGARTLSTNGGSVDVKGEMIIANTNGLTINSNNGNIRFYGLLNSGNSYTGMTYTGTWEQAKTNATSGTGSAAGDTYLATITSRLENAIAGKAVNYAQSWLGGRRVTGIGTNSLWRWVTGPEGLQDSGNGLGFFTQSTSGSGTAYNGGYSNWSSNEPNNYTGTGTGTNLSLEYESVLQFTGTTGLWNDLPGGPVTALAAHTLDYYVKETNLAASPLTINAGSGTVTFSGAVGSSKALASLNVTSTNNIAINGGAVTTEGLQTYNGNVTLSSAATTLTQTTADTDFTVQTGKTITNAYGADSSLTIKTTGNILMNANTSISSSSGKLNTILWSDSDNSANGYIFIYDGNTISTNGGDIVMAGGADTNADGRPDGFATATATYSGVSIGRLGTNVPAGATSIISNGGNIFIKGKSTAGAGNGMGIHYSYYGTLDAGSGNLTMIGESSSYAGIELAAWLNSVPANSYLDINANTINISGTSSNANYHGLSSSQLNTKYARITAGAGGITLYGHNTANTAKGVEISLNATTTSSGNIIVESPNYVAIYAGANAHSFNAGTGNTTLRTNTLSIGANHTFSSSGTLAIEPYTAARAINIGTAGAGTLDIASSYFSTNFTNGFSGITIGNATAGAITVGGATTFNDSATLLNNSTIAVNGAITANENLTLTGNGAITQNAALAVTGTTSITAGAANNVTLTNTSNNFTGAVSVISGNDVSIIDSNAMTLGAVTSSGLVDIATLTNDLTLTGAVNTTNATANAIKLNAGKSTAAGTSTGGNIIVSGGSVSAGAGGTAQLFTGSVSGSTGLTALVGSGSSRFRYNADETTDFSAGGWTALSAAANAVYREQPTVTVTASNASKTYDGLAYSGGNGVTYSGFVNGDTSAALSGVLSYGGTSQGAVNAGTYTIVPSGYSNGLGYALAYSNGSLTVNKAALTITSNNASKTYDGLAYSGGNGVTYSGFVNSETSAVLGGLLSYGGTSQGAVNAGTYAITPGGLTSSNYTLSFVDGVLTISDAAFTPYVPPTPPQIPAQQQSPAAASEPAAAQQASLPTGMAAAVVPRITSAGGPAILTTTTQLQTVTEGQALSQPLAAEGGSMPYTWRLVSGSLPQGVTLDPLSGELRGVPFLNGIFPFEIEVVDSKGNRSSKKLLLYVTGK